MKVCQPGLRQGGKMFHAIRVFDRECLVSATQRLRHGLVMDAEVADMQFVDDNIFRRGQGGFLEHIPALGHEHRVVQIHDLAAQTIHRKADRIRICHQVRFDFSGRGDVDLHFIQVELVLPVRCAGHAPDAGLVVACHGECCVGCRS